MRPPGGGRGAGVRDAFFFLINYEFESFQGQFFFKKIQKLDVSASSRYVSARPKNVSA